MAYFYKILTFLLFFIFTVFLFYFHNLIIYIYFQIHLIYIYHLHCDTFLYIDINHYINDNHDQYDLK